MVLMNETKLVGKMQINMKAYTSWTGNRTKQGGGGIATSVNQFSSDSAVGAEVQESAEFILTRIDTFKPALNVVNSYSEQRKTKNEEVEEKWGRLKKEL